MIRTELGSLILIQITPKERTLGASKILELLVQRAYRNLISFLALDKLVEFIVIFSHFSTIATSHSIFPPRFVGRISKAPHELL